MTTFSGGTLVRRTNRHNPFNSTQLLYGGIMKIISRADAKAQNLKHYYTGKPCKHGHDAERYTNDGKCVTCVKSRVRNYVTLNPDKKRESDREYYSKNKEEIKRNVKLYRVDNKDIINAKKREYAKSCKGVEARRKYRNENRDKINAKKRKYYKDNHEEHLKQKRDDYQKHKIKRNAKQAEYRKENKDKLNKYFVNRRKNDLNFKMTAYMRNMLNRVLSRSYNDKDNSTVEMLGYTCDELISHITGLFTDGMSWNNYGEWHIDHIVPLTWWFENGVTDPSRTNALINLQPLWATDNLIKGCKV